MSIIKKIRKRLTYTEVSPLFYTKGLQDAYSGTSVAGGYLKGKHVVVTGGTGGIGFAIAKRYLSEGCNVTIVGRNREKLESSLRQLESTAKGRVDYAIMDLSNPFIYKNVLRDMLGKYAIDIWVNCAGIFTDVDKSKRFRGVDKYTYSNVMDSNLKCVKLICDLLSEYWLSKQKRGQIINISSICGLFTSYGQTPYGISKAQLATLTQQLAIKHKGKIIFTCVSPGSVATAMGDKKIGDNISSKRTMLTKHIAMPEETAAVVAFLSSPAGTMVNNSTSLFSKSGTIRASAAESL